MTEFNFADYHTIPILWMKNRHNNMDIFIDLPDRLIEGLLEAFIDRQVTFPDRETAFQIMAVAYSLPMGHA